MSTNQQKFKQAIAQELSDKYGFTPVEAMEKAFSKEIDEEIMEDSAWAQHMGPEYWAEVIHEDRINEIRVIPVKPIRPTVIEFATEEEELEFYKYVYNHELTENEIKVRERLKNHKRSKQRGSF